MITVFEQSGQRPTPQVVVLCMADHVRKRKKLKRNESFSFNKLVVTDDHRCRAEVRIVKYPKRGGQGTVRMVQVEHELPQDAWDELQDLLAIEKLQADIKAIRLVMKARYEKYEPTHGSSNESSGPAATGPSPPRSSVSQGSILHECLKDVDLVKFREFLNEVDGKTFWNASHFIDMGFAKVIVDNSTRDHVSSDSDAMNQIIDEKRLKAAVASGEIDAEEALQILINGDDPRFKKEHLVAVHEIDFLQDLAHTLGTPVSQNFGRGSRGRELAAGILTYLDKISLPSPSEAD